MQYSTERGPVQDRKSTEQGMTEEDILNTAGEGITKKNPGAGIQDREDNVFSLYGVRLCNK
jgi:hypothetical protein